MTETCLSRHNADVLARTQRLMEFEAKHRQFLLANELDYFVSDSGKVVFFPDKREELRAYFGTEDWMLRNNMVDKQVDGVTVRLIWEPNNGNGEEIFI